nr:MAG TPA: hypothetical protein [Crassvirales sp.]
MAKYLDFEGLKTLTKVIDTKFVRKDGLDTTFAEVVASLPTDITKIKKHLYLVPASTTSSQNVYKEYIYTGDTSQTYNASKWEQLGEYKANVDLSEYLKKSDASDLYHPKIASIIFDDSPNSGSSGAFLRMTLNTNASSGGTGGYGVTVDMPNATRSLPGLMSERDKSKLDGIASGANKTVVDGTLSESSTNPVQNKVIKAALEGKADSDVGTFTSGVNTPVLIVNATTADEPSKNRIYTTGENGTADIILQHTNSTGAIDEVVKVNVDGIVVNDYSYNIGAIGNINNLDWTLTGNKTNITGKSVTSPKIVKTGGTSQQALMADGSVKDINDIVKYGTTAGTACQGNDARLNTGANVRVNGIALGNASKNINTNGFYVIEKIFTSRPNTVSTPSNVNKVAYYNGHLYGITDGGQICNNYGNKEQFGVVETTANNETLPKAPTNATYYNKENGLLYYNTGTTLEKVWDDLSSLTNYADSDDAVGLLTVRDYDIIMEKVNESPIQVITSEQINSLFT